MEKHLDKPLRPFRVHDIRRTVASLMGDDLDVDQGVIERCLGHLTGRQSGLMGTYQRQQYREKCKQAMTSWGALIEQLVAGDAPAANVVPFPASRQRAWFPRFSQRLHEPSRIPKLPRRARDREKWAGPVSTPTFLSGCEKRMSILLEQN